VAIIYRKIKENPYSKSEIRVSIARNEGKEIKNPCILLLFVFQFFSQKYREMIKDFFFHIWGKKNLILLFGEISPVKTRLQVPPLKQS
jgi:hypothetical protein